MHISYPEKFWHSPSVESHDFDPDAAIVRIASVVNGPNGHRVTQTDDNETGKDDQRPFVPSKAIWPRFRVFSIRNQIFPIRVDFWICYRVVDHFNNY